MSRKSKRKVAQTDHTFQLLKVSMITSQKTNDVTVATLRTQKKSKHSFGNQCKIIRLK